MNTLCNRVIFTLTATLLVAFDARAQYYGSGGVRFNNIYGAQASIGMERVRASMAREDFLNRMGVG